MAENTKIQWTDHTFNPWRGCTKVSLGCTNCYAETLSKRNPAVLGVWGNRGTRVVASETMWREPLKWNKEAKAEGRRHRVFCASLADVFEDRPELVAPRKRLGQLIIDTHWLDWQLLTKRPENMVRMAQEMWLRWDESYPFPPNVWLGTSVEDQPRADERIPHLLVAPAATRFLSVEPLLGPVNLLNRGYFRERDHSDPGIDWVIIGGESGPGARPCHIEWVRDLVRQCKQAGVACFVKQLGSNYVDAENGFCGAGTKWPYDILPSGPQRRLCDPKGGDMSEWPEDLRVREFPET